jgi:hypothetical protein
MAPLVACIIWLGVYPAPILRRTDRAAATFVQEVEHGGGIDRGSSRVASASGVATGVGR